MGIRTVNNIKIKKKSSYKEIDISVKEKERRESTPLLDLNLDNIKKQYSNSLKKNDINAPRGPKDTPENRRRTIRIIKKILDTLEQEKKNGKNNNFWRYYDYDESEQERIGKSETFTIIGEVGEYQIDISENKNKKYIVYNITLNKLINRGFLMIGNLYITKEQFGKETYDYKYKKDEDGRLFNAVYRELRRITNL